MATLASQLVANSSDLAVATAYITSTQPPPPDHLSSNGLHGLPCFKDLIAVLFECFSIMTLGYLSGRFKLISPEAKDLGAYLTTFALPMIIFLNIAQMEFSTINLSYLFCMLAAKLLLFLIVTILTLIISYPTNFGYAGALSILATQSNDFALGYPLIKSLYGETMPEMLSYLSLMAPIQLLILNPLGIGLLEFQKHRQRSVNKTAQQSTSNGTINKPANGEAFTTQCKFCLAKKRQHHQQHNARKIGINEIRDHNPVIQSSCVTKSASNHSAISAMIDPSGDCKLMRSSSASTATGSCSVFGSQNVIYQLKGSTDVNTNHSSIINSRSDEANNNNNNNNHQVSCKNVDESNNRHSILNKRTGNNRRSTTSLTLPLQSNDSWESSDNDDGFGSVRIVTQIDESISNDLPDICREITSSHNKSLDQSYMTHPASSSTSQSPFKHNTRDIRVRLLDKQFVTSPGLILSGSAHTAQSPERSPSCSSAYQGCTCNKTEQQHQDSNIGPSVTHSYAIDWTFLMAFATNPLIIASVVALAVNLINGPELPKFVTKVSNTLAASFAAPALFVVGLSMYGKFKLLLKNPNDLLLASVLVMTKILLLSSLMRTITTVILPYYVEPTDLPSLIDFSYLYGLLPTAPTVCIIAKRYNVLVNVVSISMMLSTFLSAPLMLSSSAIINQASSINVQMINDIIAQTIRVSCLVTLFSSLLTLCALRLAYQLYEKARRLRSTEILCTTIRKLEGQSARSLLIVLVSIQLIIGLSGLFKMLILGDNHLDGNQVGKHIVTKAHAIDPIPESAQTNLFYLNETNRPIQISDTNFFAMHNDLNSYICSLQYVFISTGLSLSRFVILSLAIATYVRSFFGQAKAKRVSALSLKLCVLLAVFLIIWYSRDARDAKCLPQAANMPSSLWSLCMRSVIDCVFLLVTIPVLSLLFRKENKRNYILVNDQDLSSLPGHCVVTSSASLNSDTLSALTAQTNLDLPAPAHVATSDNTGDNSRVLNDPTSVEWKIVETANQRNCDSLRDMPLDQEFHPGSHSYQNTANNNIYTMSSGTEDEKSPESRHLHNQDGEQAIVFNPNNRTTFSENSPPILRQSNNHDDKQQRNSAEFIRKSVLIVFMLISSMLSISTNLQTLLQDKPFGTFRQQEILSSAIEFGQGLTTFLLYGVRMFSKKGF